MNGIEVGDVVQCVNPRTWPFLEKGAQYVVASVHETGEWLTIGGQPPLLVAFYADGMPVIDWLPADMFKLVG